MNGTRLGAVDAPDKPNLTPPVPLQEPRCHWSDDIDEPTCTTPVYVTIGGIPYCSDHGSILYRRHVELCPEKPFDLKIIGRTLAMPQPPGPTPPPRRPDTNEPPVAE